MERDMKSTKMAPSATTEGGSMSTVASSIERGGRLHRGVEQRVGSVRAGREPDPRHLARTAEVQQAVAVGGLVGDLRQLAVALEADAAPPAVADHAARAGHVLEAAQVHLSRRPPRPEKVPR